MDCQPQHAARPVALCDTGSGSGWWLHFAAYGMIKTSRHVPYPSPAIDGKAALMRNPITGQQVYLKWGAVRLHVSTRYPDGKDYAFYIDRGGRVEFEAQ